MLLSCTAEAEAKQEGGFAGKRTSIRFRTYTAMAEYVFASSRNVRVQWGLEMRASTLRKGCCEELECLMSTEESRDSREILLDRGKS